MLKTFSELSFDFSNALVILDLDGTLVPDGEDVVSEDVKRAVKVLIDRNTVYLSSNKRSPNSDSRLKRISALLGVPTTDPRFKKPSLDIFSGIKREGRRLVVIGDKKMTDGLLALRAGGEYIQVARLTNGAESLPVKIVYWLDDMFGATVLSIWGTFF